MSKRGMDMQGGGERYGFGEEAGDNADKPMKATAAQLAKRNIAPLKRRPGTGSNRSSRHPSPAVAGNFTQTQAFQPPPGANFSFSFGNNENTPSFGAPPQQNGTPSFSFGTPQPEVQQNEDMGQPNPNPPAFVAGGFGSQSSQQPSTNGFNPSTSTNFGQSTNPSQFSFGQTQSAPQTNGTNGGFTGFGQQNGASSAVPSTGFGFSATTPKESTPSFSFAPQAEKPRENTPNFSFGAPAEKPKDSTSSGFSFTPSQPAQPSSSTTPAVNFGASRTETTQPAPSFSFGQSTSAVTTNPPSTGLFGATTPAPQPATTSGDSVFSNLSKPNGIKAGMFSQSRTATDQTPKPSPSFSFTPQTEKKPEQPKSNGFFFTPQPQKTAEPPKPNGFAFGQTSSASAETPKPANNSFNFGQSASQPTAPAVEQTPKASAGFNFGQSQAQRETPNPSNMFASSAAASFKFGSDDANMTTPDQTPKKPEAVPNPPAAQVEQTASTQSTGKSLFDRMTPADAPATAPKPRLGGPLFPTNSGNEETPKASSQSLFEAPATAPRPSTSFANAGTPVAATSTQPSISATSTSVQTPPPSSNYSQPIIMEYTDRTPLGKDWAKLTRLNLATVSYLQGRDPDVDWSPVMLYYMQEAGKILGKEAFRVAGIKPRIEAPSTNPQQAGPSSTPAASSSLETPRAQAASNIFSRAAEPPATAPVNKKRGAEDDEPQQPATEKRAKPNQPMQYPKLPDTASNTARLFESALDNRSETPKPKAGFNPSTSSMFSAQKSTSGSNEASNSQSASGFKPSGFQPTTSVNAGSFFSSFGKQAEESQAKDRKRRKEQEYDSEEEDEASWEAKDKAEREEKRRKIEEAAKSSSGFTFKPTTAPSAPKPHFSFDGANDDRTLGEKSQGSGDHTWKPETPIKFGTTSAGNSTTTPAAAPPANPFSGLFGAQSTNQSNQDSGKLAPPTVGFQFGSLKGSSVDTSRATTPGLTTDGETSNAGEAEPSDEQNEPQVEDMTVLLPEETANHEVLFETRMARAVKLEAKKVGSDDADGSPRASMQPAWVEKGRGPLYVLKDKSTGKTRVLLKVPPLGRPALNHPLVNMEYKLAPNKDKVVQCTFIDHTGSSEERAGKPSTWTIQVKEASEASELVKIFNDNRS